MDKAMNITREDTRRHLLADFPVQNNPPALSAFHFADRAGFFVAADYGSLSHPANDLSGLYQSFDP